MLLCEAWQLKFKGLFIERLGEVVERSGSGSGKGLTHICPQMRPQMRRFCHSTSKADYSRFRVDL